jgi:uncharacterized iron-regulated protein
VTLRTRHRRVRALVLAFLVLAAGCAGAGRGQPPIDGWQAPLGRAHPLAGRVWDVAASRFVDPAEVRTRLAASRYVLLGETHGNPDHHRLQAWSLRALIDAGRRPAVAFEMLTDDHASAVARYLAGRPPDAAGLGDAVAWARSGWPDWRLYQPIADLAVAHGLPILTANLGGTTVRALARGGAGAVDPALASRWGLGAPLPAPAEVVMANEIREAHCGHASDRMVTGMIAAQRARDARMAESLLAGERDGAVLIAGAGHVRRDHGVPFHLARRAPGARVLSVGFLEVRDDLTSPPDYGARFGVAAPPFDLVWFTPRTDDQDPCERFRKSLEKLRESR